MDAVVLGLLQVVGISLVPVAIFSALLHADRAWAWAQERATVRTLARRPGQRAAQAPDLQPLERIAADLRRLYPGVHCPVPGTRMAKQRGVVLAYDDRLVDAARALELTTVLRELDVNGFDREAERLRLEYALAEAGLRLEP